MSVLDLLTYYDFLLSYNVYALCQTFGGFRGIRLGTQQHTVERVYVHSGAVLSLYGLYGVRSGCNLRRCAVFRFEISHVALAVPSRFGVFVDIHLLGGV